MTTVEPHDLLSDEYSQAARLAVEKYIRDATRHETSDVRFSGDAKLDVEVVIDVSHRLFCRVDTQTEKGNIAPGFLDLIANSEDEQTKNCKEIGTLALREFNVEGALQADIRTQKYGHYKDDAYLGDYRKKSFFNYACHTCRGVGEVTCRSCGGDGRDSCGNCGGFGSTTETVWSTDSRGHSTSSMESHICMSCGGSGHRNCSPCGGRGTVTCGTCGGLKSMTEIATQQYFVHSDYTCMSIYPKRQETEFAINQRVSHLAILGDAHGVVESRDLSVISLERTVNERAVITVPFYVARVHIPNFDSKVTVFGGHHVLADVGGVVQKIVQADLHELNRSIKRIKVMDLWSLDAALNEARTFMLSEVHQHAVEKCPKRRLYLEDFKALSADLACALNHKYLEKSIRALLVLHAKAYREYERFGWLLAAPILALLFVVLMDSNQPFLALIYLLGGGVLTHWLIKKFTAHRFKKIGGNVLCQLINAKAILVK
jgi:hypothetical protein